MVYRFQTAVKSHVSAFMKGAAGKIVKFCSAEIHLGRAPAGVPDNSILLFPLSPCFLGCGLAGIVSYKGAGDHPPLDLSPFGACLRGFETRSLSSGKPPADFPASYLGGDDAVDAARNHALSMKTNANFIRLCADAALQAELSKAVEKFAAFIEKEEARFLGEMGHMDSGDMDIVSRRIEILKDINWCLESEVLGNIRLTNNLITRAGDPVSFSTRETFKKINAVLKSIDRLEVRGRDSAGITVLFTFDKGEFERYRGTLYHESLMEQIKERANKEVLLNRGISIQDSQDEEGRHLVAFAVTYKVAAEIGSLGDNVAFIRNQIRNDALLQIAAGFNSLSVNVTAHTRWASVGAISEANCHPVDNTSATRRTEKTGLIHICLNGDIDNHRELKEEYEHRWDRVQEEITTDTKIIALQIEGYLKSGHEIKEAFLMAVNDFEGSHAISMVTSLSPGKLFLAQKGSGQAVFVGIAGDHYMPASEVYGFIEESDTYLKMDGETVFTGKNGKTQGQIFILDGNVGGIEGVQACYYDSTPIEITEKSLLHTEITSRDIDRQDFPHYFLKEISESPVSVEKTIQNRWKYESGKNSLMVPSLDDNVIPPSLAEALRSDRIRRIYFIGQGTAGVAAAACANILSHYLDDPQVQVSPLKASELSGFFLKEDDTEESLRDTLVIAISQSGTTTDTNRTVDMIKERGARTLAIVNRRDSDLTFKTEGVLYTSSGRDIEMSVASTKAFYSQIVAGTLLSLHITALKEQRSDEFISGEIEALLELPSAMKEVLALGPAIKESAEKLAPTRTYWAAVGSGPNKASADEIRIKLSELCYKTISSDYIEDKKHIDLSSEPLILVCTAGTKGTVIGDIIKDTAIFSAHKACPVVIADKGEDRFTPYAASVFHVPKVSQHLAPIVNTLVGHIWGYYAALSINRGSSFMFRYREELKAALDDYRMKGLDLYEVVLEKGFREKVAEFYNEFRVRRSENRIPAVMGFNTASDLTLLLKYLSGRLPVTDFELDFGKKGTPGNMLDTLFECMGNAVNNLARPVDAIKHQAKTVTVGTSRSSDKMEGLLFETLSEHGITLPQITNSNVLVLKNLQGIIATIKGAALYRISGLNLLGEPVSTTRIELVHKRGDLESIPSRVETDKQLKGTKHIIVREGNVYLGKGRKDNKNILVVPVISAAAGGTPVIEYILSLHVGFKESRIPLFVKIKALGGKFDRIRNTVAEHSVKWDDKLLDMIKVEDLFGDSAEKTGDYIVANIN